LSSKTWPDFPITRPRNFLERKKEKKKKAAVRWPHAPRKNNNGEKWGSTLFEITWSVTGLSGSAAAESSFL